MLSEHTSSKTVPCNDHRLQSPAHAIIPVIIKNLALALLWAGAPLEPTDGDRCQTGPFLEELAIWWEDLGTRPAGQPVHWPGEGGLPGEGDMAAEL